MIFLKNKKCLSNIIFTFMWYMIGFEAAEAGKVKLSAEAVGRASFGESDSRIRNIEKLLKSTQGYKVAEIFVAHMRRAKSIESDE